MSARVPTRAPPVARPIVLTAPWLYVGEGRWCRGGGLVVAGERVLAVLPDERAVDRTIGQALDRRHLSDATLTPGFVVAHAHLELSALRGLVPPGPDFPAWIETLIRARAAIPRKTLVRARASAAIDLLHRGATTVGDVDSLRMWSDRRATPRPGVGPRLVVQAELLDAHDPARTAKSLRSLFHAAPRSGEHMGALAPHAAHTTSAALLAGVARIAARLALPVSVHFAESEEEVAWLAGRGGPFERLLGPSRTATTALDLLDAAGLLGPRTALVHANHPEPGDNERIARAGCTVVHCPGAHRFFGRAPFAFDRWRAAGVPLALGTDSAAGNDALDPLRELALARAAAPWISPLEWLDIATAGGARAVGHADTLGHLSPGAFADIVVWPRCGDTPEAIADAVTSGEIAPSAVWVGGRPASV